MTFFFFFPVDCWDGPGGEPLIYHGYTLTTQILFRDVLVDAIKPYAFYASEYPVILSLENHCSEQQQETLARHLRDVLGGEPFLSESALRITEFLDFIHLLIFQKLENLCFRNWIQFPKWWVLQLFKKPVDGQIPETQ
jgi:hypothetical protein